MVAPYLVGYHPMHAPFNFRPALAAALMLAILAGAYLGASRLRHLAPAYPAGTARPAGSAATVAAADAPAPPGLATARPARPAQAQEPPQPPCRPQPLRLVETVRAGPRRYVGTVGGLPATAEIDWSQPDSLSGRFYLWRNGIEYDFSQAERHHPRVLVLGPAVYPVSHRQGGRWLLRARPGAVLQGTWVDAAGQHPRPFVLRESYAGGVRYDIRQLALTGGEPSSPDSCDVPTNRYDFLHLLGPAASRPPLSRAQCLGRSGRRHFMHDNYNNETQNSSFVNVELNDFGLLSYQEDYSDSPFEGTGGFAKTNVLIDLASGRQLTITSQLRPGYELPLRYLLAKRLRGEQLLEFDHGEDNPELYGWEQLTDHGRPVKLPYLHHTGAEDDTGIGETWVLCAQGLKIGEHLDAYRVTISYPELRPLVRPGTPLARMLRARGLW